MNLTPVYLVLVAVLCLSDPNERAHTRTIEQRNMVVARIKIMCLEQLVDPPIDYFFNLMAIGGLYFLI